MNSNEERVSRADVHFRCLIDGEIWVSLEVLCMYADVSVWHARPYVAALKTRQVRLAHGGVSRFYHQEEFFEACRDLIVRREHNPGMLQYRLTVIRGGPQTVCAVQSPQQNGTSSKVVNLKDWRDRHPRKG